jgi:hypothetical protein
MFGRYQSSIGGRMKFLWKCDDKVDMIGPVAERAFTV